MAELFTTFETVEPPKIVSQETKQNYQDIMSLYTPSTELPLDWNYTATEEDLLKPSFNTLKPVFTLLEQNLDASKVINLARLFVGNKYKWGGSNPNTGFDCSGLIQYVFKSIGLNLPRTAKEQGNIGLQVDISLALPGDVIWFGSKNSPSGLHIGLVSKVDNGLIYIIDAAGKKLGVTERALPNLPIKSVRRLIGFTGNNFNLQVLNFFKNKGLTEALSRGILGNLIQESRGNHTITNKNSGAFGLAQWLGPRKLKLILRYGNNPTMLQLLEFIWEELNTTESKAFKKLLSASTVAEATKAFAYHFERAGKNEMNINKRIQYAYTI